MIFNFSAHVRTALRLAAVLVALAVAGAAPAEPPPKLFSRAEAAKTIAEARRIVTPGGIERLEGQDWRYRPVGVDAHELVVHPRMGGILHGRPVGPARRRQDTPSKRPGGSRPDIGSAKHWLEENIRSRPLLGQLPRSGDGQAPSRVAACLHRRWPADRWARERTPRLDIRHGERPSRGKHRGGPRTQRHRSVRHLPSTHPAQGYLHSAEMAGLLRRRHGLQQRQHRRERPCRAVAGLHRRGDPAYLGSNAFGERYLLPDVLSLDLTGTRKLGCPLIVFPGRHDVNVNSKLAAEWSQR